MQLEDFLIDENMPLITALGRLDASGRNCVFVVDDSRRLRGSLTDGDIRRMILRTGSLDGRVAEAMNTKPTSLLVSNRLRVREFFASKDLTAIPLVNEEGVIEDVVFHDGKMTRRHQLSESIPVVIMAGGVGSRLAPLTDVLPKPLIPISGTTIIERIIKRFTDSGCKDFYLVLNYRKGMIKAYFEDVERDYGVTYVEEEEFLGTGGGLKLVTPYINSTFLFTNCDILVDASVNDLLSVHRKAGNAVTCVCSLKNSTIPYGTIEISPGGEITEMKEKPTISALINTGCYMVEPEVLRYIGDCENVNFPDVMTRCQKAGLKIGVFPISEGAWLDMGQFEEMKRMNALLGVSE